MPLLFFATDLHGYTERYEKLFDCIASERPTAVLLGGDLLPRFGIMQGGTHADFLEDYLFPSLAKLRSKLASQYPTIFVILGNDDPRSEEECVIEAERNGLLQYIHSRKSTIGEHDVYGYACVPPTPFLLKDWERYDVSRYIPPACVSPEEGRRSVAVSESEIKWGTIAKDLERLVDGQAVDRAIFLFHTPPHETPLDRAALDGKMYEYVPLDVNVGSIAVRRFIEEQQPLLTLHGHIHESTRMTGEWMTKLGRTVCINGAHDGPELALVRFDSEAPSEASRELL